MLVGWLAALIIPALAPARPMPATDPGAAGSMIGILVVAYFLARRRGAKRPWVWVVVALVGVFMINFVGGYRHASGKRQALETDFMNSIEHFDPVAGAQLKALENDKVAFPKAFAPVLSRAVLRAPDNDVIALSSVQEQMVAPTSDADLSRCVAAAKGTNVPSAEMSPELQRITIQTETALLNAAASNPVAPPAPGKDAVIALLAPVYARVDPRGVLDDPAQFAKLSDTDQCQMYLGVMSGIHALPTADAGTVLRYLIGGRLAQ
jgi:hypothetical protein